MKALNPIVSYDYGRTASLGGALRAWTAQNSASEHEAATYLQQHGINGAVGNFPNWLNDVPSGELFTIRIRKFEELTGIDADRLMVVAAKRNVLKRDPSLEGIVTFETNATRREMVEMALAYAETYGGNMRCVTFQLGVAESRLSAWKGATQDKKGFLPSGDDLERLVVGISRGLLNVSCVEDYFLSRVCEGMLGLAPEVVFPGINRFESLLKALFHILGKKNSATDKKRVFDLEVNTVDRLRKWKPRENLLPLSSVVKVVRALLKHRHPRVIPSFDAATEAFVEHWTLPRPLSLEGDAKDDRPTTTLVADAPAAEAEAPEPPGAPEPNEDEATPPATVPDQGHDAPVDGELLLLLKRLQGAGPHLRGLADALDPAGAKPASVPNSPFASAIGETVDGMEHCLDAAGFPDFRESEPSEEDVRAVMRALALTRKLLLSLGGLSESRKTALLQRVGGDLQETILLAYGLLKYADVRTARNIIQANLQMGRGETRSSTHRRKQ